VSLSWTPDGNAVVFTAQQEWLVTHTVWWGELESATASELDYAGPGVVRPGPWSGSPRFSPTGDQLLLIAGSPTFDIVAISVGG
jgi:WD40-like Beta Propeller Repeat